PALNGVGHKHVGGIRGTYAECFYNALGFDLACVHRTFVTLCGLINPTFVRPPSATPHWLCSRDCLRVPTASATVPMERVGVEKGFQPKN
ncbi:hypothetical protein SK128_016459, partial [Halocaridina rubra]